MDGSPLTRDRGESAYARIREAIRDGALAPGERLTEVDLATRFGVSRTPVRQAIARLESEGLLTHEARRGLTVTRPDHQQVVELYVMREILEGAAARLAAQHASDTEIAAMAEIVEREPAVFADASALAAENQRLHGLLYLAAHNRYLLRSLEQLGATMSLLPTLLTRDGRAEQAHAEHRAILKAIQERDGEAAEATARRHARAAQKHRLAWMVGTVGVPLAAPGSAGPD
ncbi:GntR family transcriptional regulator [Roseomonas terrae]|uniref:GntR family transcriptional regulator n=1 Tax=Neoroseomonas terrae TaxID=424799 RepID=A0ABS5EBV9_9PROT|nr:GntR family transcriptional regulator [Neoroseomonas terrae]MBR0648177.1 GntR family transcriptional regulator [Neoroseomonas terrae]